MSLGEAMQTMLTGRKDTPVIAEEESQHHEETEGQEALIPLPEAREELKTDWHDPHHDFLFVEILDIDGEVLEGHQFPAPVNTNADHPCWIRISVGHSDGCYKVLTRSALPTY